MATSKIITYDLCKSGKNYDDLYKYLKAYSVWARITESTWFISTDKTCVTIREEIDKIIDSDDRIFVGELTGTAAWRNVICDSDYLKKNL
ncbi:CRISPR-associated protein Cas2 [Aminipila terrae]|uniref:CRISPR-associated protein Cas2 n=1 Tax=Aminipila terrae TaxID=2697030 RepID=A0A6P1MKW3_9FIRM|nr:CRISPR-associated protein Cas2 [Aminipila terrae]QHI73793.1 CRISPR-associated protein Cas2 [Aminipila terrae]